MLRHSHDVAARVSGRDTGEDGCVDDKQIVCAPDAGVQVDDGSAACRVAAVVRAEFVRAYPVVGASVGGGDDHLWGVSSCLARGKGGGEKTYILDVLARRNARVGVCPGEVGHILERVL